MSSSCGRRGDELALLRSMYAGGGELRFEQHGGDGDSPPPANDDGADWCQFGDGDDVAFTLALAVDGAKLSVWFCLPAGYPDALRPSAYVRADGQGRATRQHCDTAALNASVRSWLDEQPLGEPLVHDLLQRIDDFVRNSRTADGCAVATASGPAAACSNSNSHADAEGLERTWIWSHHIYSLTKRKNIVHAARELKLTGFVMAGKPGVICVEGEPAAVLDFWNTVRRWNWHKLERRNTETCGAQQVESSFRKFAGFDEFVSDGAKLRRQHMGEFREYLKRHSCLHAFAFLFNIDCPQE